MIQGVKEVRGSRGWWRAHCQVVSAMLRVGFHNVRNTKCLSPGTHDIIEVESVVAMVTEK